MRPTLIAAIRRSGKRRLLPIPPAVAETPCRAERPNLAALQGLRGVSEALVAGGGWWVLCSSGAAHGPCPRRRVDRIPSVPGAAAGTNIHVGSKPPDEPRTHHPPLQRRF